MPLNIDSIYDICINLFTDCNANYSSSNKKLYNFIDTGYIYTLDPSDNLDYQSNPIKQYQNSRADYLMRPYNKNQLRTSKFNNEKTIYQQKKVARISIQDSSSSHSFINTMRTIQRQNRVDSSSYITNLTSLTIAGDLSNSLPKGLSDKIVPSITKTKDGVEYKGVDQKHGSYQRYLARLKSGNLKSQIPVNTEYNNKNIKTNMIQNCKCI